MQVGGNLVFGLILVTGLAGYTQADTNWEGAVDSDWYNESNWDNGEPNSTQDAYIENTSPITWPVLNGGTGNTDRLTIAHSGSTIGELTVTGGATLNVGEDLRLSRNSAAGQVGILYISGSGTQIHVAEDVEVGRYGDATIDMSGGLLKLTSSDSQYELRMGYRAGSSGTIYLRGGIIEVGTGSLDLAAEGAALINIYGGTLIIDGDVTSTIATYINEGIIIAYGGAGAINVVSDGNTTTITALKPGENLTPVVDAGEDKVITPPDNTIQLDGTVSDDGIGEPNGFLEMWWSLNPNSSQNAPVGVTFADLIFEPNEFVASPDVTFPVAGEYELCLYVSDGEKNSSDIMTVMVYEQGYVVNRLNNSEPIITEAMFETAGATHVNGAGMTEGENINGPSLLRIPDWIAPENRADPNAVYYLYFAHHRGDYIRMAWAEELEGPWRLYNVGTGVPLDGRGVLSLSSSDDIEIGNDIVIDNHIASPDVFADGENQRIIMYFHSPTEQDGSDKGQSSFAATSTYGLDFNGSIEPVILGGSYFRVFEHGGYMYAFDNGADLFRALDANDPWTPPPGFDFGDDLWIKSDNDPFAEDLAEAGFDGTLRHTAVRLLGDTLQVFYSRKYDDRPERILMSTIDLSVGDYDLWDSSYPPEEILQAEPGWEGGQFPPDPSSGGDAPENVNQLRDPYIFEDIDGTLYLFYAGCGEDAIGLAQLISVVPGDFEPDGDVDLIDLGRLLEFWLTDESSVDIVPDGIINFLDYAIVAENWTGN